MRRRLSHRLRRARWARTGARAWSRAGRVGVAVWVLRWMLLTPSPLGAEPQTPSQDLRVQDVLIEGKLYSPQAVFILSRPAEAFGSDSVLPHYLGATTSQFLLPLRLHAHVLDAALHAGVAANAVTTASDSSVGSVLDADSRRSQ